MPERRLQPDLAQWVVQALARLVASYAILQGVGIVAGGPGRWQSRGLASAMAVPGAPASWGWVLAILGVAALYATFRPRPRVATAALCGIAAWSFFFAYTLVATVITDDKVATTGPPVYTLTAILACVLAVPYWKSRR